MPVSRSIEGLPPRSRVANKENPYGAIAGAGSMIMNTEEPANRIRSSRRALLPGTRSMEKVDFMPSDVRARLNNPNIANKGFNPILHSNGPGNHSMQGINTTSNDYGANASKSRMENERLIAPNTTAGSNNIF